jgi:hypothetical protein
MEQLTHLQREYLETKKCLAFALSIDELNQLTERRRIIRAEAKALAKTLNIPQPGWLTLE